MININETLHQNTTLIYQKVWGDDAVMNETVY